MIDRPQPDHSDIWQDAQGQPRHAGSPGGASRRPQRRRARSRRPWLSVLGYAALAFACLGAGAAAFLVIAAPVDVVRDRIIEQVKARTGRDLAVAGPISFQLFPRPAVSLSEVSLSARDAGDEPAALVAPRIDAELSLWSILVPNAAVQRVVLHRPVIELGVDAQGRQLWSAGGRPRGGAESGPAVQAPQAELPALARSEPRSPAALSRVGLASVRVIDGTVRYRGRGGDVAEARSLDLMVSLAERGGTVKIDGTAKVQDVPVAISGTVESLQALLDRQPVRISVKASGPFAASYDGMVSIADGFQLDGAISCDTASTEALGKWIGKLLPDPVASGRLAFSAKLQASRERVSASELRASVGGSTVAGSLAIDMSGERRRVSGTLDVADLDLGRLLVKPRQAAMPAEHRRPTSHAPPAAPSAPVPQEVNTPARPSRARGWSEQPYNLAILGALDADLAINARRITYKDLATGPGRLVLALDRGTAKVTLERVDLYGGRAAGVLSLDGTGDVLVAGANLQLQGVELQPLLGDGLDFQWLEGRGQVSLAVAGQGLTERQVMEGLNGKVEISSADGAIVGLDVGKIVHSLRRARLPDLSPSPSEKTPFKELAATFAVTNGVAHNDDLRLTGPNLQLNGEGKLDLGRRLVDYTVRTKVGGAPESDATLKVGTIEVPISISGPWDKPSFGIKGQEHLTGALKQIRKNLRSQDVKDALKGLLEGDGEKRVKARDLIDKLLKKE